MKTSYKCGNCSRINEITVQPDRMIPRHVKELDWEQTHKEHEELFTCRHCGKDSFIAINEQGITYNRCTAQSK